MPTRPDTIDIPRSRFRYTPSACPENVANQDLRDWLRREFDAVRRGMIDPEFQDDFVGVWDDWKFPLTRHRQGALSKPDFDETNLGLLFPQNDTSEVVLITDQVPHAWMQGTVMEPHVHYIQDEAAFPVFTLQWRIYANGGTVPAFATISTESAVFTYTSGTLVQILKFPSITPPAGATSALADFKLYRNDNVVTGDVLAKSFDIHYRRDSLGSRNEYTKAVTR